MFSAYRTQDSFAWKPIVAGLVGGAAGTMAMGYYWKAVSKISGSDPREEVREEGGALDEVSLVGPQADEGEGSTAALGRMGYEMIKHEEPTEQTKQKLSQGVHWTYGTAAGGLYGALRARNGHAADVLGGATYGTLMWLLGSEVAVPLLGLSPGPTKFPLRQHAHGLGAHLAYGVTAALTAQQVKNGLDRAAKRRR